MMIEQIELTNSQKKVLELKIRLGEIVFASGEWRASKSDLTFGLQLKRTDLFTSDWWIEHLQRKVDLLETSFIE